MPIDYPYVKLDEIWLYLQFQNSQAQHDQELVSYVFGISQKQVSLKMPGILNKTC